MFQYVFFFLWGYNMIFYVCNMSDKSSSITVLTNKAFATMCLPYLIKASKILVRHHPITKQNKKSSLGNQRLPRYFHLRRSMSDSELVSSAQNQPVIKVSTSRTKPSALPWVHAQPTPGMSFFGSLVYVPCKYSSKDSRSSNHNTLMRPTGTEKVDFTKKTLNQKQFHQKNKLTGRITIKKKLEEPPEEAPNWLNPQDPVATLYQILSKSKYGFQTSINIHKP